MTIEEVIAGLSVAMIQNMDFGEDPGAPASVLDDAKDDIKALGQYLSNEDPSAEAAAIATAVLGRSERLEPDNGSTGDGVAQLYLAVQRILRE